MFSQVRAPAKPPSHVLGESNAPTRPRYLPQPATAAAPFEPQWRASSTCLAARPAALGSDPSHAIESVDCRRPPAPARFDVPQLAPTAVAPRFSRSAYYAAQMAQVVQADEDRAASRYIAQTYGAVAAGLGITAGTATLGYTCCMPALLNPLWGVGLGVASLVSLVATLMTDPQHRLAKVAAFGCFTGSMGLGLAGLGFVGLPILVNAGLITGAISASLAVVAARAGNAAFMHWQGPLLGMLIGLCVVGAAQALMPPTWALSAMAQGLEVFGGIVLFSALTLFDTRRLLDDAQKVAQGAKNADPIGASLHIYLNMVNLFVRIVEVMAKTHADGEHA